MAELSTLGSVIKTAYEGEAETNAFTDAEKTKLLGIETGAEANTVDSVNGQTGVVVIDADDIDDTSTINKFVTASDITVLGNTSGTNTGDQDLSGLQPLDSVLTNTTASYTTAEQTKLLSIEAGADVTDEANVTNALDGATLTDIGTPASGDRILIQDASDTNNLKYVAFSEFGGGGGGSADGGMPFTPITTSGEVIVSASSGDAGSSTTTSIGRIYLVPFVPSRDISIQSIGFRVNSNSGNAKMCIYDSNADGSPDTLINSTTSSATAAAYEVSITQTLSAGVQYWLGYKGDAAFVVKSVRDQGAIVVGVDAWTSSFFATTVERDTTYADAFPNPFVYTAADLGAGTGETPIIYMRTT